MKYFYYLLILTIVSCKKQVIEVVKPPILPPVNTTTSSKVDSFVLLKSQEIAFNQSGVSTDSLYNTLLYSTPGALNYEINGVEHLILTPSLQTRNLSPLHFVKKDTTWVFTGSSNEVKLGNPRNYKIDKDGTVYYAEQGLEYSINGRLPFGDLWRMKTNGDILSWTKISNKKSFFHDVAIGDINNDGKTDVIGAHLGTDYENWLNEGLLPFISKETYYEETRDFLSFTNLKQGAGATLIVDLNKDGINEILQGDYGLGSWRTPSERFSLLIFTQTNGKYSTYLRPELGVWGNDLSVGATSMKSLDYDNDGDLDLAVAYETNKSTNGIQLFENKGNLTFTAGQYIETTFNSNQFREFEVMDVDKDGFIDIVTHPFHNGSLFRTSNGIILQNNILLNKNNKFVYCEKSLPVNIKPGFMKGFMIKNNLKFIGVEYQDNKFKIVEVIIKL